MAERKTTAKKLSTTNTKQEMLDTYNELVLQTEEKRATTATPEQKIAEKTVKQAVAVADALTPDSIICDIGGLKAEVGKVLTNLADSLEQESRRYEAIKRAITEKEKELAEIYEIQKAASSLTALIEAQTLKKEEYEADMAARKESLTQEIEEMKTVWQKEKVQKAAEQKEQDALDAKKRVREKEEYEYTQKRECQAAQDAFSKEKAGFDEEKARLEREIALRREQTDREFSDREQAITKQEQELVELRTRVAAFPKELESTVNREVKAAVDKAQAEAKFKLELALKEFEGERNVLKARISSLEAQAKEQSGQIAKLMEQVEKSYAQVQAIAVKAVEGPTAKTVLPTQQLMQQRQGE
ncbi:MAG: hypothetical protein A2505_00060 [Deltaproteobacteria bacterium RIFOXYD12_FULL_55_16]|nr:MAG: hypothetical protein A2505_00060 [Deltaproteobacteria bacterium RIFOXYD12_FULL_55_16]